MCRMAATPESRLDRGASAPSDFADFAEILCAIDGTQESLAAVEQAATLAGPKGHLTLLEVTSFEAEGAYRSPAIGPIEAKRILDAALRIAEEAGVPSTVEVDPASPAPEVILDWAAERDLLAIGAPSTSWFGSMFTGGVAITAERSFTTPLLVARSTAGAQHSPRRILIASDGLDGSDRLVELGGRLARAQGASAILVHALGSRSAARRQHVEEQAHRLQLALDGASEARLEPGSARTVIVETAVAVEPAMVVMSSRRLKGPRAVGSVSRRVVHHGNCSVLLVPPERF